LKAWNIPQAAWPGSTPVFSFHWEALRDLTEEYSLFIHLFDAQETLVASYDGPAGALPSSTWRPAYPVYDEIAITLPDEPGTYQVYLGLYHAQTRERLTIDAPDNRLFVGEIVAR
jgi:hypothetical protein